MSLPLETSFLPNVYPMASSARELDSTNGQRSRLFADCVFPFDCGNQFHSHLFLSSSALKYEKCSGKPADDTSGEICLWNYYTYRHRSVCFNINVMRLVILQNARKSA